jgi:hypothetical protein
VSEGLPFAWLGASTRTGLGASQLLDEESAIGPCHPSRARGRSTSRLSTSTKLICSSSPTARGCRPPLPHHSLNPMPALSRGRRANSRMRAAHRRRRRALGSSLNLLCFRATLAPRDQGSDAIVIRRAQELSTHRRAARLSAVIARSGECIHSPWRSDDPIHSKLSKAFVWIASLPLATTVKRRPRDRRALAFRTTPQAG